MQQLARTLIASATLLALLTMNPLTAIAEPVDLGVVVIDPPTPVTGEPSVAEDASGVNVTLPRTGVVTPWATVYNPADGSVVFGVNRTFVGYGGGHLFVPKYQLLTVGEYAVVVSDPVPPTVGADNSVTVTVPGFHLLTPTVLVQTDRPVAGVGAYNATSEETSRTVTAPSAPQVPEAPQVPPAPTVPQPPQIPMRDVKICDTYVYGGCVVVQVPDIPRLIP